jgi:hypothetical protein
MMSFRLGCFSGLKTEKKAFTVVLSAAGKMRLQYFPGIRDDVEEASKCYALERYVAAIFHLMRVTEAAVLALGKIVDPDDFKPQFSSVRFLRRLTLSCNAQNGKTGQTL